MEENTFLVVIQEANRNDKILYIRSNLSFSNQNRNIAVFCCCCRAFFSPENISQTVTDYFMISYKQQSNSQNINLKYFIKINEKKIISELTVFDYANRLVFEGTPYQFFISLKKQIKTQ